jgi:hypothetical protein
MSANFDLQRAEQCLFVHFKLPRILFFGGETTWCHSGLENTMKGKGFHCFRGWFAYVQLNDSTYIFSKQQPATKNATGTESLSPFCLTCKPHVPLGFGCWFSEPTDYESVASRWEKLCQWTDRRWRTERDRSRSPFSI